MSIPEQPTRQLRQDRATVALTDLQQEIDKNILNNNNNREKVAQNVLV